MEKNKKELTLATLLIALFVFPLIGACLAQVEEIKREESFIMPMSQEENWFIGNPYNPMARISNIGGSNCLWEPLFMWNADNGTFLGIQAKSYEYLEDYTKIKIVLRQGIKWSDGETFNADDLVFTFNMLLEHAELLGAAWVQRDVDHVEKIDEYTVLVHLKGSLPRTIWNLVDLNVDCSFHVVPEHIWKNVEDPLTFEFREMVWTGPYTLYRGSSTEMIYKRRDDWWMGVPGPKWVIFRWIGGREKIAMALEKNEIDQAIGSAGIEHIGWSDYFSIKDRNPHVMLWYHKDACNRDVFINCMLYPLNLPEVRKALSLSFNRTKICQLAIETGGFGWPAKSPIAGFAGTLQYLPVDLIENNPWYKYDPAKAADLMTSIGFTLQGGVWTSPNGTKCSWTMITQPWQKDQSEIVAEDWRANGFDVTVKQLEYATHMDKWNKGDYELAMWCCFSFNTADPYFFFERLYSNHGQAPYYVPLGQTVSYNQNRWRNETYDTLFDELKFLSVDHPRSIEIMAKLMEIYYDEMPGFSTYENPQSAIYNTVYWKNWPAGYGDPDFPENTYAVPHGYFARDKYVFLANAKYAPPPPITYVFVWFTESVAVFTGTDKQTYGPFKAGDYARIPEEDATKLSAEGVASYSPPVSIIPGLEELSETLSAVASDVSATSTGITNLRTSVTGLSESLTKVSDSLTSLNSQMSMLTTGLVVEAVAIIMLAAAIVVMMRKK